MCPAKSFEDSIENFKKHRCPNSFHSHFTYDSYAALVNALRKMRGEVYMQGSLRDAFDALSDNEDTVDLHRFR